MNFPAPPKKTGYFLLITILFLLVAFFIYFAFFLYKNDLQVTVEAENLDSRSMIKDKESPIPSFGNVPVLLTFHMETATSISCENPVIPQKCKTDEEFDVMMGVMERLIASLDANQLKGTFEHQITWLMRLEESDRGKGILQSMIDGGHEIALHHHGAEHGDPDGYSDAANAPSDFLSMKQYMDYIHGWEERWNYQIVTMEGTGLLTDNQSEWIYRTSDDNNNKNAKKLDDPQNFCPTGRPSWSIVALPNQPISIKNQGYTNIGHTSFTSKIPSCTEVLAKNILDVIDELDLNSLESSDAINIVIHPSDYANIDGLNTENMDAFDDFFSELGDRDFLVGMTVRDYMCERVGACE